MYASSECYFGLNLRPMCDPSEVSYTLMPNMCYFEFLPMDAAASDGGDVSQLVYYLARVEVGREYELQVMGFHNSAPQFRFVSCKNVLLSIESDKTDEAELQRAVPPWWSTPARLTPRASPATTSSTGSS